MKCTILVAKTVHDVEAVPPTEFIPGGCDNSLCPRIGWQLIRQGFRRSRNALGALGFVLSPSDAQRVSAPPMTSTTAPSGPVHAAASSWVSFCWASFHRRRVTDPAPFS